MIFEKCLKRAGSFIIIGFVLTIGVACQPEPMLNAPIVTTPWTVPSSVAPIAPPSLIPESVLQKKRALQLPFLEQGSYGRTSPNFRLYCLINHRADFILQSPNVDGWKCKKGDQIIDINYKDLCSFQFKNSKERGYDDFNNPASVYCKLEGELPIKEYRYDNDFSPYSCDSLGICRLDGFKFYSQIDSKIVNDEDGLDAALWNKLTYTDGLCVPTAMAMAIDTLYAQSNIRWRFSKFMKDQYHPKKEGNFAHNVRALADYFGVLKYFGVTQTAIFGIGYLSDQFYDDEYVALFEHFYPAVATTESLRAAMQNKLVPLVSYGYYQVTEVNRNGKKVKEYKRESGHMEVLYAFDDQDVYSVDPRNSKMDYFPFRIQKTIHCDPSSDGKDFTSFSDEGGNCFLSVMREMGNKVVALEGVTYLRMGVRKH